MLDIFPDLVVYMDTRNPRRVAVYRPDLATLARPRPFEDALTYHNQEDKRWLLTITHNKEDGTYKGKKTRPNGEFAGMAVGKGWEVFFVHLTQSGAHPDEPTTATSS